MSDNFRNSRLTHKTAAHDGANTAPYQLAHRDLFPAKEPGLLAGCAALVTQTPSTAVPLGVINWFSLTYK